MKPLLVPVPIHDGESLQGLAVRANMANHYESVGITLGVAVAGKSVQQLLHECTRGDFSAEKLAILTHNPVSSIEQAEIRLAPPVVGRETDHYLVIDRWRLCPECFDQAPFHRRLWALACVTACLVHGKTLIDSCGTCGTPLDLGSRLENLCPKCKAVYQAGKPASAAALELTEAAESGLAAHTAGNPAPLADLHTRFAIAIMLADPKYLAVRSRISPQLIDLERMAHWVERIGRFSTSDVALAEYAARVVAMLSQRWKHLPAAALVTLKRVTAVAGTALPEPMRSLVDGRYPSVAPDALNAPLLVSPSDWEVPSEVAAEILGVSRFVLLRLLNTGLITSRLKSEDKSKNGGLVLVTLDSLEVLMAKLDAIATEVPTEQRGPLTHLWNVKIDEVIPAILSGAMALYRGEGDGLGAFRVRYQETRYAEKRRTIPEGFVTVEQAAMQLLTYRAVVDRLMDVGKLSTERWHGGHVRLIRIESLNAFDREFVLVGTLARQHGLNSTNLAEKLQFFGINAVMGPVIDGGLVKAFRRKDVAGLDFEKVKALKHYETKAGRRKRGSGETGLR